MVASLGLLEIIGLALVVFFLFAAAGGGQHARGGFRAASVLLVLLAACIILGGFFLVARHDKFQAPPAIESRDPRRTAADAVTEPHSVELGELNNSDFPFGRGRKTDSRVRAAEAPEADVPEADVPESDAVTAAEVAGDDAFAAESTPVEPNADSQAPIPTGDEARPSWVDEKPHHDNGIDYRSVKTDPRLLESCEEELARVVREEVQAYIVGQVPDEADLFEIPYAYIRENILVAKYYEEHPFAVDGPMYIVHARLAFNRSVRREIDDLARRARIEAEDRDREDLRREHLATTAGWAGVVLALVATVFGYLKLDTLTRGFYSRRLQVLALLCILLIGVAASVLVEPNLFRAGPR
jgi:hypothetical protein